MIGGKHNRSAVADEYHLNSSLPRSQTSRQSTNIRSSQHTEPAVGVRREPKTLHDQVGEGGHPSDAAHT